MVLGAYSSCRTGRRYAARREAAVSSHADRARTVGVVGIDKDEPGPMLTPEQQRLLDALADQAALAVERVSLAADMDRVRFAAESDRLRSALLTSISHDLRTPLSSILGSA